MNTKFFFFLLICLLITNNNSDVIASKKENVNSVATHQSTKSQANKDETPKEDIPMPNQLPKLVHDADRVHTPNSDDDGKHHHFHFGRIAANKRRWLMVLFGKLFLIIVHVCCFLYCYLHAFH